MNAIYSRSMAWRGVFHAIQVDYSTNDIFSQSQFLTKQRWPRFGKQLRSNVGCAVSRVMLHSLSLGVRRIGIRVEMVLSSSPVRHW